jgi:hypothetical protein
MAVAALIRIIQYLRVFLVNIFVQTSTKLQGSALFNTSTSKNERQSDVEVEAISHLPESFAVQM